MNNIRKIIKQELIKLGYNIGNIGTLYLVDVIEVVITSENQFQLLLNLEKNVYNKIAEKYNQNPKTVKSDIIKATNKMNDIRDLKHFDENLNKLSAKMVVMDVVDKLKNEYKCCI